MSDVVLRELRRRGYGAQMIAALLDVRELAHVELMAGGVEPDNVASVQLILGVGFEPLDARPDFEGFVYYVLQRRAASASHQTPGKSRSVRAE